MRIVCRCYDITEEEIIKVIKEKNITSLEELKRYLNVGMGECQGRTCIPIIIGILSRITGKSPDELEFPKSRPPSFSVRLGLFVGDEDE
ncbi:MAG TPA: (2Fe-2S)-binding protein [Euryarchaeota archaeon]|nr:(2Fe-2S)-binding protein [Euryarchaeota archaeon]